LTDLRVDRRIILKQTINKSDVRVWNGYSWLNIGSSEEPLEHSNTTSAFGEVVDQISDNGIS
jgi:hypothetical protein